MNNVFSTKAAESGRAFEYFQSLLGFETDCWDVNDALSTDNPGFILVDVRHPDKFAQGHIPGAINLPHWKIVDSKIKKFPIETLFVAYCAGPHCNGAIKGALRFAELSRPVKIMIGGVTGWLDEGFLLKK